MVPGSTLRYGSSLMRVTLRPRDSRIAASDAAAMPLPSEDTTPPVTKTNLVIACSTWVTSAVVVKRDYIEGPMTARYGRTLATLQHRGARAAQRIANPS